MYNYYVNQVRQDIKRFKEYEKAIEYLYSKFDQLSSIKADLEYTLSEIGDENGSVVEVVYSEATQILEKYALLAIRETREFDLHQFRSRLIRAIRDERTIRIYWNSRKQTANIVIDLDTTAGNLSDYARAIDLTREQLKIGPAKPFPMEPDMASYMWMEKYYKPAREGSDIPQPKPYNGADEKKKKRKKKERHYNVAKYINAYKRTIRTRLSNMRSLAPFWRILNYGSQPLYSDWGGTGYPTVDPTHFVERAKKVISAKIAEQLRGQNSRIDNIRRAIAEVEQARRYVRQMLYAFERKSFEENQKGGERSFLQTEIKKQLGVRLTDASIDEIISLVNSLALGQVSPDERVTLRKITGGTFRMRVKRLSKMLEEYRNSR